MQVSRM